MKLRPSQVKAIRAGVASGYTMRQMAARHGVSSSLVCRLCRGQRRSGKLWGYVPDPGGRPRKLSAAVALRLRQLRQAGLSYRALAKIFRVSAMAARDYCRRRP